MYSLTSAGRTIYDSTVANTTTVTVHVYRRWKRHHEVTKNSSSISAPRPKQPWRLDAAIDRGRGNVCKSVRTPSSRVIEAVQSIKCRNALAGILIY